MERYTIFKSTGNHSDVIAAVGAADILREREPQLVNCGDRFEVRLQGEALPEDLAATDPGFLYLPKSGKLPAKLSAGRIFKRRSSAAPAPQPVPQTKAIDPEQRMYSILGRLNAAGGPNKIVREFARLPREEWRQRVWNGLHGGKDFVTRPLLVQLFNPQAARGYSLLKPAGTGRNDRSKNKWSEPFTEWLRYRGFFAGCAGWFLDKDIRVFCPVPGNIPYRLYREVAAAFRELRLAGSTAKVDCRAVLGLTLILIDQMDFRVRPRVLIEALSIAHYRNMGQANTLMAIEQLALPDWFELRTGEDLNRWRHTIYEHDRVLKGLSDNKSDEIALLKQYRNVLQFEAEPALREFVGFLVDYGAHAYRRLLDSGARPLSLFTIRNVEAILRPHMTYQQILENQGFQAISRALRAATVSAITARHNDVFDRREVRNGVLSQIRRSLALGKHELLTAVSGFIADFNAETARRYQNQWRDARITDEEAVSFAMLLDTAPSAELVGSMLCALATCRRSEAFQANAPIELARAVPA